MVAIFTRSQRMRTRIAILGVCIFLIMLPGYSIAQESGSAIPACADDEVALIILSMREYVEAFTNIEADLSEVDTVQQLSTSTSTLVNLRNRWWDEIVPAFPRCDLAIRISLLVGRTVDDFALYFTLVQAGYLDDANIQQESLERLLPETGSLFQFVADANTDLLSKWLELSEFEPLAIIYHITSLQTVNGRSCPRVNCDVIRQYPSGAEIDVVGIVDGDAVDANVEWLHLIDDGVDVYIHSALASPS